MSIFGIRQNFQFLQLFILIMKNLGVNFEMQEGATFVNTILEGCEHKALETQVAGLSWPGPP